jgi:hypothetical protein
MRCYNGYPDSKLQALLDRNEAKRKELTDVIPGASCTYFPVEECYQCFLDYKPIGPMLPDLITTIDVTIAEYKAKEIV